MQLLLKSDKSNGTLHGDSCIFIIISLSVLLKMKNVSDKTSRESNNTHFIFKNVYPKSVPFMR